MYETDPLQGLSTFSPPVPVVHVYAQPCAPEFLSVKESVPRDRPWFAVRHLEALSHFENGLETVGQRSSRVSSRLACASRDSALLIALTSYFAGK
jgi:hypothetical protein